MYERGTRPAAYLREYAREFSSVEVDSTFYGTPAPERLLRWAQAVPPGFTFALKLTREITHERRLIGCERAAAEFFDAAAVLGPKLEAVLVQLPPDFGPDERDALTAFIRVLPAGPRIALEVRDPRWFAVAQRDELLAVLRDRGIALAVSDGTFVEINVMLAAFAKPTASFGYVRWLGRRTRWPASTGCTSTAARRSRAGRRRSQPPRRVSSAFAATPTTTTWGMPPRRFARCIAPSASNTGARLVSCKRNFSQDASVRGTLTRRKINLA